MTSEAGGDKHGSAGGDKHGSMRSRALISSLFLIFQAGGAQMIRLAGNLILTRILAPDAFGLIALINVLMIGVIMFTDIGVRDCVLRSPREDSDFLNTAWTVKSIHGVTIWVLVAALCGPYADFYEQPILADLAPVAAFQVVFKSLESTKVFQLERELLVKKIVPIEIATQVVGLAGTIVLALWFRSVWGLVWGLHVGSIVRLVLTHVALPGVSNRLVLDRPAVKELFGYGRWVVVSSTLSFGANQLDRLVLGKLVPIDLLGVFGIAKTLAMAPQQVTDLIGTRVVFPVYRMIMANGEDLSNAFERARRPLLVAAGWVLAGVTACAQPLVDVLYDDQYEAAGQMLRLLPFGIWFQTINSSNGAAIRALGLPRVLAMASAAQGITLLVGLAPVTTRYGIQGGIWVLVAATFAASAASTAWLVSRGICKWYGAIPMTLLTFVSAYAGVWVEESVPWHPVLRILAAGAVTTLFWAYLLLQLLRQLRNKEALTP